MKEQLSEPTPEQLAIGRGEPSGPDVQWKVKRAPRLPVRVYYTLGDKDLGKRAEWAELPGEGVQVLVFDDGVMMKGADEYEFGGVSKYGIYMNDDEFESLFERARLFAVEQYRVGRG